ncbi:MULTISPECIES: OB-fold protein [Thioalkalivibrio]|uniref:tRNA_anti-like n=1 Tax=Thioalkalivibrio halophilus TaxID=252474 RepID=A0A1V2ZY53_9GAMM|nr:MULTISPECIES: hypothetical protein [Thioalkalivibrio]OOC10032.1 hypothetical protein B1A74_07935 [Thioalkalivibrio halophilus]
MKQKTKRHLLTIGLLSPMLVLALGSYDEEGASREVAEMEVEHRVSAQQLFSEYDANEVRAGQTYEDTVVAVTGTVDNIGRDIADTPYITFGTDNPIVGIQCMLAESDAGLAASVDSGDRITLKGRVSGKLGNVVIRGCQAE